MPSDPSIEADRRPAARDVPAAYSTDLSHETLSKITDEIGDEILAWQARSLEALYPVTYLDAQVMKARAGAVVKNRAAHVASGIDMVGIKHVHCIWVQATEGST